MKKPGKRNQQRPRPVAHLYSAFGQGAKAMPAFLIVNHTCNYEAF